MNDQTKRRIVDGIIRPQPKRMVRLPSTMLRINRSPQVVGSKVAMFRSSLKMAGIVMLAAALMTGLSSVGHTVSYFNDVEKSSGNRFRAGTIVFDISSTDDFVGRIMSESSDNYVLIVDNEEAAIGTEEFAITVGESDSSLPLLYDVSGVLEPSNPAGCETLAVDATFGEYHYKGLFKDFVSPNISQMGEWRFVIALPVFDSPLAPTIECKGKFVFHAGLAGVAEDLVHTFQDQKEYDFELYNWNDLPSTPAFLVEEPAPDYPIPEDTGLDEGLPQSTSSIQTVEATGSELIIEPEAESLPDSNATTTQPQDPVPTETPEVEPPVENN